MRSSFAIYMFKDYESRILDKYRVMKETGRLPLNLILPTPASIKNECIAICDTRYLKTDEKFLREFFEPKTDVNEYQRVIQAYDTDRFKPLCNFLRGKVSSTNKKNIELLAWLIDFPSRPYRAGWIGPKEYDFEETINEREELEADIGEIQGTSMPPEIPEEPNERAKSPDPISPALRWFSNIFRKRINIILPLGLVLICGLGYTIYTPSEPVECMYWTGDHYAPISCTRKISAKAVIALDTMKAAHFRKITTPDTITLNSLGHVWYSKINGKVEFFTSDGVNPEHPEKELKHATRYMIKKYGKQ